MQSIPCYSGSLVSTRDKTMAHGKPWSEKVLVLIAGGNIAAAIAQIRVAPGVKDLRALRAAVIVHKFDGRWRDLDEAIADNLDALAAPRLHRSP